MAARANSWWVCRRLTSPKGKVCKTKHDASLRMLPADSSSRVKRRKIRYTLPEAA